MAFSIITIIPTVCCPFMQSQADLPDLVGKVGRLCECKVGPAGAVSGYLAYGTSMDYLYVNKRVPYPLTVEVYGGGNIGKLRPGEVNKELDAWTTVNKAGAPIAASAEFQRRHLQQQQQQQQQSDIGGKQSGLISWLRRLLQEEKQQQPDGSADEQQQQRKRRRRHRRRGRLQRVHAFKRPAGGDAGSSDGQVVPLLPDVAAAAPAEPVAAAPASGFSAGGNLAQLRQQMKQQLLQEQQPPSSSGPVLSIPTQSGDSQPSTAVQDPQAAADPLLAVVSSAQAHLRQCFDAFNPASEGEYRRVVADWLAASLIMMKHMVEGPAGQAMVAKVAAGGGGHSRLGSRGRHGQGGVTIHTPSITNSSSSSSRDLLAGHC